MKNLDQPANALTGDAYSDINGSNLTPGRVEDGMGFTKRERACIDLRIPESGDAELDALIEKARRQEVAAKIAAGLSAAVDEDGTWSHEPSDVAFAAKEYADALLAELERTHA